MARPEEESENVAIVLADAFEVGKSFGPMVAGNRDIEDEDESQHQEEAALPWCLQRVANVPLLSLTLDALQSAKMDKVYIYANAGFTQIQTYLKKLQYSFTLQLKQTASVTEGDVLREADALELKNNFVLVRAGYVGNVDLGRALKEFAHKRKQDVNLVLDSILIPRSTPRASLTEQATYAITPTTRLAHYQPPSETAKRLKIPREIINEGLLHHPGGLDIRADLSSTGVDICSPEVCPLFSENFDWMNLRTHFVVGVLTSDLLGKTISCTVVGESVGQSGRKVENSMFVQDPAALLEANLAFLQRRFYPLAPDEYLPAPSERLSARGKVYLGRKVEMARTLSLNLALVEGSSSLKANSSISASCLGSRCIVGARSKVSRSVLGSNCVIEEDVIVDECLIGDNVTLGKGTVLKNCLVGPRVKLGEGSGVEDGRLSVEPKRAEEDEEDEEDEADDDDDEEEEGSAASSELLGPNSEAYIWSESEDSEDDSASDTSELAERLDATHLAEDDSCSSLSITRTDSMESLDTLNSDVSLQLDKPLDAPDTSAFESELHQSVERAFVEDHTIENLVIELKTMRMSSNVAISTVRESFLKYLVSRVTPGQGTLRERYALIEPLVERWGGVLPTLAPLEEPEQVEVTLQLQAVAPSRDFVLWLRGLYEADVVSEESVLEWWKDARSREEDVREKRDSAAAFVRALLESSSSEEESSDEEEE